MLMDAMNQEVLGYSGVKLEKREEYAITYVSELLNLYKKETNLDESTFVSGRGHRKGIRQKQYQEMQGYLERLKTYAHHIEICGDARNSYSKTDHDATFMRKSGITWETISCFQHIISKPLSVMNTLLSWT